jgi:hypothetical protein
MVGDPMGSLASVDDILEEKEPCACVVVPENMQSDLVEKITQGSMLAVMNVALKLFGFSKIL